MRHSLLGSTKIELLRRTCLVSLILAVDAFGATGNLVVTVRNANGSTASGARVVRYSPGGGSTEGYTNSSGQVTWNGITTGAYSCEAYYTGVNWLGEEYWGDGQATVSTNATAQLPINRIYPYIESVE